MNTPLIIDRPSLVPPHKRILFGVATLAIWSLWIYLWLALATLIGWAVGGYLGYKEMVLYTGYIELLHLLGWYALVIAILGGALVLWAIYNVLRFRGRERRVTPRAFDRQVEERHFRAGAERLREWRAAKTLNVEYNSDGVLQRVAVSGD